MTDQFPMRGAIPSPQSVLAAASPYSASVEAPPNFIILPKQISFWGNYSNGDCVTAEEAFAKTCNNPEIFISDNEVIAWATSHGVLNGAHLPQVMGFMQNDGFVQDDDTYDDGPYYSVDFTNSGTLQSAISEGPVKLGVAADQLLSTWYAAGGSAAGGVSGWFATKYQQDTAEDHCVTLCGYGTISWLAQQLGVQVPAGIDGTQPGYALFTWDSIGIIDVPSMIAITGEAWLRKPTTVIVAPWADNDLTGRFGGPGAAETPVIGIVTQFSGEPQTGRVIYRAADSHLHELSYVASRSWADNDLTDIGGGPGADETPVIGIVTQFSGEPETGRVIYRAADSHLHELSYRHSA
jgi:hypothetical protein